MKRAYEPCFNNLTKKITRVEKVFKQIKKIENAYYKLKQREAFEDKEKLEKSAKALKDKLDEYIEESKTLANECNGLIKKIKRLPYYNSKELRRLKRRLTYLRI